LKTVKTKEFWLYVYNSREKTNIFIMEKFESLSLVVLIITDFEIKEHKKTLL